MNVQETEFKYNDIGERYKRMNQVVAVVVGLTWMLFLIFFAIQALIHTMPVTQANINVAIILCFIAAEVIIYKKNKKSSNLHVSVAIAMGIELLLIGVQTDAEFVYFTMLIVLVLLIPYYDFRALKLTSIGYGVVYFAISIRRALAGSTTLSADFICRSISVYVAIFAIYQIGLTAKKFSDHTLGVVKLQGEKQKGILDGILDISHTVEDESDKSDALIQQLVQSLQSVAESMKEITQATNTTAESIQEQNGMTQAIQDAIGETGKRSKEMVGIATESNKSIKSNMALMGQLKEQADLIATTNNEVTDSMEKLQAKTKDVEEIAGMILNISSQTNLLALNASIESARAGEAGKGFAVVADQIRQLAEQTRNSTEEITAIVNELNENANDVVHSLESSVEAMENQNSKINEASESFEKMNEDMGVLIQNINDLDMDILNLGNSNNKIVESISQLSAATEEVTASAEGVRELSQQNLEDVQKVMLAIENIHGKTDSMKELC